MTLTILAVVFFLLILLLAVFGQRLLSQKTESLKQTDGEQCALCRNSFTKSQLIERQVSDAKTMYFCRQCIERLMTDLERIQPGE